MIIGYAACIPGPYHIANNMPCQDAYTITDGNDGFKIAACADGLGSEQFSGIGSKIASETAVIYCSEHIDASMNSDGIKQVICDSFAKAYHAVGEQANKAGNNIDEYDTTLCLVVYDGSRLYYGQSGDSGIVAVFENGQYVQVTSQQRDEEGYVYPLRFGAEYWSFGYLEGPVTSLMLMTDGIWSQICPPLLSTYDTPINVALTRQFLDRSEYTPKEIHALEERVKDYLLKFPEYLIDDDKTVVVLYNSDKHPATLEPEYYTPPDWEKLLREHPLYSATDFEIESDVNINGNP